jgi:hypothetical protein
VSTSPSEPPWKFLLSASRSSLQSYELSRLNCAANLRTDMVRLLDQLVEETASAQLARWLIKHREMRTAYMCELCGALRDGRAGETASDNLFGENVNSRARL